MSTASDHQPCYGSDMGSMSQIASYFRAQSPTAAPPAAKLQKSQAIAAAKATAADLKVAGFKGRIRVLDQRIELLARTAVRPGKTLHLTWHPLGQDVEWLKGSPAKHWQHILR